MIKTTTLAAFCLAFLLAPMWAQQPNSPNATLTINGNNPVLTPITGVNLPVGLPFTAVVSGGANVPWVGFAAAGLASSGFPVLGGQLVDLNNTNFQMIFNGLANPAFTTDNTGVWTTTQTLDSATALGVTVAVQAAVIDATHPNGVRLTAATEMTTSAGITCMTLALTEDGNTNINLTPYFPAGQTNFNFYASSYNNCYVHANGFVSFSTTTSDFTPSAGEMVSGMPRICGFWTDLSPQQAPGQVQFCVDQTSFPTRAYAQFTSVPAFSTTTTHTFRIELELELGNVRVVSDPFNPPENAFTQLAGITPGGNLSSITTNTDISAISSTSPLITGTNDAIFEWFGQSINANWPLPTNNIYDLTATTMYCDYAGPGVYVIYNQ